MNLISESSFEVAVIRFFGPLAGNDLKLAKLAPGVFEIKGSIYALRIRRGTGHHRGSGDFLVTLSEIASVSGGPYYWGEIGLRNFVEFKHELLPWQDFGSLTGFPKAMEQAAQMAGKLCMHIVKSAVTSTDFEQVKSFVDQKIQDVRDAWKKRRQDGTQFSWEK